MHSDVFELDSTYVHLGLGATAEVLRGFRWDEQFLERYTADHAADGDEGRLVLVSSHGPSWTHWERHPAGDELVVVLSGRVTLVQERDSGEERLELGPGQATVNARGVWHTADVHEAGQALFVTPGRGTEHRPR